MDGPIEERYSFSKVVGRGAFSEVFKGRDLATGNEVAIKKIALAKCKNVIEITTEVELLSRLDHPNIVRMFTHYEDLHFHYIITELLTGGELFDEIVERGQYTERDAASILQQLLGALDYLHGSNIIHRDLKPENILCASQDDKTRVVITDFGLAKQLTDAEQESKPCGTPGYAAPEVLLRKPYGTSVDIFSLGVTAYILLCGYPPFYSETDNDAEICKLTISNTWQFESPDWDDVTDEAKSVIRRFLEPDPANRWTASQALEHRWIKGRTTSSVNIARRVSMQLSTHFARNRWKVNRRAFKTLAHTLKRAINAQVAIQRLLSAPKSRDSSPEKQTE